MIRVSIETPVVNVGKTSPGGQNWVPNYWVVQLLNNVVRALDMATPNEGYKVREHLIEELSRAAE